MWIVLFPLHGIFMSNNMILFFFLKFLTDTRVLFSGHWYPCFGFLVTSPLGFKARVGSALFAFCGGECNVDPRSTSGATLADLLVAGAQPILSPHMILTIYSLYFNLRLCRHSFICSSSKTK